MQSQRERLKELSNKLHWFEYKEGEAILDQYYGSEVNLYLDNHMMQTFRMCESRFMLEFVEGYSGKGHFWFLDFGICVHTMIEYYYIHRKDPDFNVMQWAGVKAYEVWAKMNMDELYNSKSPWHHKNYTTLGGCVGFSALLLEYASLFHQDNERFRVIGAELYFGKSKEVYLGTIIYYGVRINLYLSGKIDLLMDDGSNIGPMDHKTSSNFGYKNPATNYEIHEGMIGYVFAARKLLQTTYIKRDINLLSKTLESRTSNKMWMNFLQVEPLPQTKRDGSKPNITDRFKRIPFLYTDYQLETYRKRQLRTAGSIMSLLLNPKAEPYRNTMACTNYMRHTCSFNEVHRQNSKEAELVHLNSNFTKGLIWDPEDRDHENLIQEGD